LGAMKTSQPSAAEGARALSFPPSALLVQHRNQMRA